MEEKNYNINISDNYGNKIMFNGSSVCTPNKFRRTSVQTLSAETREYYMGISETLTINITHLNEEQYQILKNIFYSSGKKNIITEKGENFRMIFNSDSLTLSNDFNIETYEIFYYGTIEMVS